MQVIRGRTIAAAPGAAIRLLTTLLSVACLLLAQGVLFERQGGIMVGQAGQLQDVGNEP